MLKKINNKYQIIYYREINKLVEDIGKLPKLESLRTNDYAIYNEVITKIDNLGTIGSELTAEELIDIVTNKFNITEINFINKYYKIPSILMDILYYLPQREELLMIPRDEAEKILRKKLDYDLINLFQLHDLARELRATIAIPVQSTHLIQKHGLVPISSFEKRDTKDSIIIQLQGKSYFTSIDLFKSYPDFKGVSTKMTKSTLTPVNGIYKKSAIIYPNVERPQRIFETFDGIHFRELKTTDKNIRMISAIANGYNSKMNYHKIEPLLVDDKIIKSDFKIRYTNILAKIDPKTFDEKKEEIREHIIELLADMNFDMEDKFLIKEFRLCLSAEMRKIKYYLNKTDSFEHFKEEVMNNEKNFILKFQKKLKIYEHTKKISRAST